MKTLRMFDFVLFNIILFLLIGASPLLTEEALPSLPVITLEQAVSQGLPSVTLELEERVALLNGDSFQARTLARDRLFLRVVEEAAFHMMGKERFNTYKGEFSKKTVKKLFRFLRNYKILHEGEEKEGIKSIYVLKLKCELFLMGIKETLARDGFLLSARPQKIAPLFLWKRENASITVTSISYAELAPFFRSFPSELFEWVSLTSTLPGGAEISLVGMRALTLPFVRQVVGEKSHIVVVGKVESEDGRTIVSLSAIHLETGKRIGRVSRVIKNFEPATDFPKVGRLLVQSIQTRWASGAYEAKEVSIVIEGPIDYPTFEMLRKHVENQTKGKGAFALRRQWHHGLLFEGEISVPLESLVSPLLKGENIPFVLELEKMEPERLTLRLPPKTLLQENSGIPL